MICGWAVPKGCLWTPIARGFGRVGCGLGGSAGFSAGFRESDMLTGVNPRQASVSATLIGFQRTGSYGHKSPAARSAFPCTATARLPDRLRITDIRQLLWLPGVA
jgi:hypothetical protein